MTISTPKFDFLLEKYNSLLIKEQDEPIQPPQGQVEQPVDNQQQATTEPTQETPEQENQNKTTEGYAYLTNIIYNLLTLPSDNLPKDLLPLSEEKVQNTKQAFNIFNKLVQILPADLRIQILKANFGGSGSLGISDQDMIEMANVALRSLFFKEKLNNEFTSLKDDVKSEITKTGGKVSTDNASSIYSRIKNLVGVEVDTQE